jgi:hypothetical protein
MRFQESSLPRWRKFQGAEKLMKLARARDGLAAEASVPAVFIAPARPFAKNGRRDI